MLEVLKKIQKDYGAVFMDTESFLKKERKIVSISPCLDLITNGGIPEGSWVVICGKEKMGKTTVALTAAKNAQALGMKVVYADIECRLKPMNIQGIQGLDVSPDRWHWIRSTEEKIIYIEDYLNILLDFLRAEPCFMIVDSFSALASDKIADKGIGTELMGKLNHYISDFINCATPLVAVKGSIIVGMGQYYANTSGYGKASSAKIANRLKYQGDIQLAAQGNYPTWIEENGRIVGHKTKWICDYAALPGGPGKQIDSWVRHGVGIDVTQELIELGMLYGLIEKKGKWNYLNYMPEIPKFDGRDNLAAALNQNVEYFDLLQKKVAQYGGYHQGTQVQVKVEEVQPTTVATSTESD